MERNLNFYNYTRNRDKLFANLINMIEGLTCDGRIDEKELIYLDTWLLESDAIKDNYCVQAIRERIEYILSDGIIDESELKEFKSDLLEIQSNMHDIPGIDLYSAESDKHLLEGLCKGMIANHQLVDEEIHYLNWWLSNNGMLKSNFPGKELYKLVQNILADGIVTHEESDALKQAMISFTGCDLSTGIVDGLSTRLPVEDIDSLNLQNAVVCLTGKFIYGNRDKCKAEIEAAGGVVIDNITQKLNYLIIGTLVSKDWRFQSYGRKIEQAVEYRDNGIGLKIISEEQWRRFPV